MATTDSGAPPGTPAVAHEVQRPRQTKHWVDWVTTTDHKKIGIMYLVLTFVFFILGGVEALLMRLQLGVPNNTLITGEHYNELLTMHGTTMIFLFVVPVMAGFGNYFVPLMIGARDMAFPRLNALSFWLLLCGGIVFYATLFWHPPEAGWWSYPPLSSIQYSPSGGQDAWIFLIHLTGISSLLGAINFYVTIVNMRAPGMSWGRLPLFIWAILIYAVLLIIALPVVAAAVTMLLTDRHFGTHFFDPTTHGSPVLWENLFWFFGHPEVYIMILPGFGIISEVIPVFSRKPIFGYKAIAASTAVIAFLATLVWAHHMFASPVPIVVLGFFMLSSFLIGIPTGVKIFNWIATLWRGSLVMTTSLYFAIGFIAIFIDRRDHRHLPRRLPGRLAAQRHLLRRRPLPLRADGRRGVLDLRRDLLLVPEDDRAAAERDAREESFWVMFIGFNMTFFVQHALGLSGMPRRIYTYQPGLGWSTYNLISTIGAFILGLGDPDDDRQRRAQPQAAARWRDPTRGRATRSSGSRPRRRRSTTSTRSRACARSSRCATSAARSSARPASRRRPAAASGSRAHEPPKGSQGSVSTLTATAVRAASAASAARGSSSPTTSS